MSIRGEIPAFNYAAVEATSDGENTVIEGTEGKKITVIGYALAVTAEGTIVLKGTTTKAKFNLAKQGGVSYSGGPDCPAFQVSAGTKLVIENPAGVDTLGHITYLLI